MIKHLTSKDFKNYIDKEWTLVDFYADWCGPCRMLSSVIDELSKSYNEVKWAKINVDEELELAQMFAVMSIPRVILFHDGKQVASFEGFRSKEQLIDFIEMNKNKK